MDGGRRQYLSGNAHGRRFFAPACAAANGRNVDAPGPLYAIQEGRLRAFELKPDGQRHYFNYLRKGDFFGEISVFRGTPRTASIEAVADSKLLMLPPAAPKDERTTLSTLTDIWATPRPWPSPTVTRSSTALNVSTLLRVR